MDYRIFPPESILEATISLPTSKSIALRETALAWLAGDISTTASLRSTNSDADTLYAALEGISNGSETIDVHDCGAAMRFVTALAAATPNLDITLTGTERLCQRPVKPLVDALRSFGANIEYLGNEGFPPLKILGAKLNGGEVTIDASGSSQYTSALMLAAPLMASPLAINLSGVVQSAPYISMTAALLNKHGVAAEVEPTKVSVPNTPIKATDIDIEPDWSAAAFWYEIAAISAGWVTLNGLREHSIQGDRGVALLFERLGVLTEYTPEGAELSATPDIFSRLDADLTDMPDSVPALAVTAALAGLPFHLTGVGVLKTKESDRLEVLASELAKIGIVTETENYGNTLCWDGRRRPIASLPEFDPHGDHRMAMAFAAVAIFIPGIVIKNAEVVAKSYPTFWNDLISAGFTLNDPEDPMPQEGDEE